MRVRISCALVMALLSLSLGRLWAEDEGGNPPPPPPPHQQQHGRPQHPQGVMPIEVAIKHAQDLGLTDEQVAKLKEAQGKAAKAREAINSDPDIQALHKKIQEARKAGNAELTKSLHKELQEAIAKKGGAENPAELLKGILSKEQMDKLHALLEQERPAGKGPGGAGKGPHGKGRGGADKGQAPSNDGNAPDGAQPEPDTQKL